MNLKEVMLELESYGDPQIKKIFLNHGVKEPLFGVRVGDMKNIVKKVKKNYELSLQLYDTGNSDAMYLAGLVADEKKMSKKDLQHWADKASNYGLSEYTVAWIAAESLFGFELGLEWIDDDKEKIATAGWSTLSSWASMRSDDLLDVDKYSELLDRVEDSIHDEKNRVRYTMNSFVIAVGSYIPELTKKAQRVAEIIGKVHVDVGGTACKVPLATTYIQKVIDRGTVGRKKKKARC